MCTCLSEIEAKMHEHALESNKGDVQQGRIVQSQFPFTIKGGITGRILYSEYGFQFAPRKKDGTIGKHKNQSINISHSYCAFCGQKHDMTEEEMKDVPEPEND